MRLVKPYASRRRAWALAVAATLALIGWGATPAAAYVPPVDDLWARLVAGAPLLKSAIVDTETVVFDPAQPGPAGSAQGAPAPKPLAGRDFRQRIYWQRGALLAVETLSGDGTPLHLMLRDGYRTYEKALSTARTFAPADLHPVLYPFLEASAAAWRDELVFWGIQPLAVALELYGSATAYVLGEGAGQALWIDRNEDRPVRLEVRAAGPAPLQLAVQFSEYMPVAAKNQDAANPRLPKVMTYEIGGRLFRRTTITDVQADAPVRSFPLVRWRQELGLSAAAAAYAFTRTEGGKP